MGVKFQSRVTERGTDGITTTIVWNGSKEEMAAIAAGMPIGFCTDDGQLKSVRVYQESPRIWHCEQRFTFASDGELTEKPDNAYGKKSAQLKGSMLSMPLESHKNYLTCWNYYLAGAPNINTTPAWAKTATDTVISADDSQKYAWIKTPGELPKDENGHWHILANPIKPGVENYDVATYSITETARFRSANAAGRMVANNLNKIGKPDNTFGIRKGNWKCDDASISWNGNDWLATLTWTLSGNEAGWDRDLYE